MPQSAYYTQLEKRHEALRKALLPKDFSPIGNYRNSTYEKVSGYKLLIHAEIEYYLEEIAKNIIRNAYDQWKMNKIASKTLMALIAYCPVEFPGLPQKTTEKQKSSYDLEARITKAVEYFNTYLRAENHGIKEKNMLAIFLPIGVAIADIDNNLLIALENFGRERGKLAHSTRAQNPPDPQSTENEVIALLTLVQSFDTMLLQNYPVSS